MGKKKLSKKLRSRETTQSPASGSKHRPRQPSGESHSLSDSQSSSSSAHNDTRKSGRVEVAHLNDSEKCVKVPLLIEKGDIEKPVRLSNSKSKKSGQFSFMKGKSFNLKDSITKKDLKPSDSKELQIEQISMKGPTTKIPQFSDVCGESQEIPEDQSVSRNQGSVSKSKKQSKYRSKFFDKKVGSLRQIQLFSGGGETKSIKKKTKKKKDQSEQQHRQESFFDRTNSLSQIMTTENDDSPTRRGATTHAVQIQNNFSQGTRERGVEYQEEGQGSGTNIKIEIQDDQQRGSGQGEIVSSLRKNESSLSMHKVRKLPSIDTKPALGQKDKIQLQNADFEKGSSQFDIPLMNYRDSQNELDLETLSHQLAGSPLPRGSINRLMERISERSPSPIRQVQAGRAEMWDPGRNLSPDKIKDKAGLFNESPMEEDERAPREHSGSSVLRVLTRYVTSRHTDDASIKDLIEQKRMKEQIFDSIFEQFTHGKKLQKYDEYKQLIEYRQRMNTKRSKDKDEELAKRVNSKRHHRGVRRPHYNPKKEEINKVKSLHEEASRQLMDRTASEKSFMRLKKIEQLKQKTQVNQSVVKVALAKKEISVNQANLFLYQSRRQENKQMVQQAKTGGANNRKNEFKKFCQHIAIQHFENQVKAAQLRSAQASPKRSIGRERTIDSSLEKRPRSSILITDLPHHQTVGSISKPRPSTSLKRPSVLMSNAPAQTSTMENSMGIYTSGYSENSSKVHTRRLSARPASANTTHFHGRKRSQPPLQKRTLTTKMKDTNHVIVEQTELEHQVMSPSAQENLRRPKTGHAQPLAEMIPDNIYYMNDSSEKVGKYEVVKFSDDQLQDASGPADGHPKQTGADSHMVIAEQYSDLRFSQMRTQKGGESRSQNADAYLSRGSTEKSAGGYLHNPIYAGGKVMITKPIMVESITRLPRKPFVDKRPMTASVSKKILKGATLATSEAAISKDLTQVENNRINHSMQVADNLKDSILLGKTSLRTIDASQRAEQKIPLKRILKGGHAPTSASIEHFDDDRTKRSTNNASSHFKHPSMPSQYFYRDLQYYLNSQKQRNYNPINLTDKLKSSKKQKLNKSYGHAFSTKKLLTVDNHGADSNNKTKKIRYPITSSTIKDSLDICTYNHEVSPIAAHHLNQYHLDHSSSAYMNSRERLQQFSKMENRPWSHAGRKQSSVGGRKMTIQDSQPSNKSLLHNLKNKEIIIERFSKKKKKSAGLTQPVIVGLNQKMTKNLKQQQFLKLAQSYL